MRGAALAWVAAVVSSGAMGSVAGIVWEVPEGWVSRPERPMRAATYALPAAAGDERDAECAVYYFGPGQGGSAEANIARWMDQFLEPEVVERARRDLDGMAVETLELTGTYLSPGGPRMRSQGIEPDFRLLSAIAAAPEGNVFFKCTGPDVTLRAARPAFEALLDSISRVPGR